MRTQNPQITNVTLSCHLDLHGRCSRPSSCSCFCHKPPTKKSKKPKKPQPSDTNTEE